MATVSAVSTQYVYATVQHLVNRVNTDPTGYAVSFAFLPWGETPSATTSFVSGSWATDTGSPPWTAQCLIGPEGVIQLEAGNYGIWVQIAASPENPVLQAPGQLSVV